MHNQGQAGHGNSGGKQVQTGRTQESWILGAVLGGRGILHFSELPALAIGPTARHPSCEVFLSESGRDLGSS